ncbi:lipoprotein N-acyltransferase Lnb domain-containing protein [Halobacteriovorax sp. DPLXC-1]|uniref:lipoprotein N-acyltransferase Lnb domain-containing protein n=1 Tax=Halobacteriovorax sp. DPLXC-1 TaxID=3110771 RepID=UPI002FEFD32B
MSQLTIGADIAFRHLDRNERDQFLALTNWKRYARMVRVNGDLRRQVFYRSLRENNKYDSPKEEFNSFVSEFYQNNNFKCNNLAAYEFFVDITGERAFESQVCDNHFSTFISVATGYKEISFYKNRVLKISYLMASNGESAMSRFGHSMFYVRACKKNIDNCPLKYQTEFILGVAADVDDLAPGLLKGIFGGYDTKLNLMTLTQVKQKYNYDEFRDLDQYDLNLTKRDIHRFISHSLRLYEQKDMGSYKFFSANCATESYKLLRATIDKNKLRSRPLTPKGLLKDLVDDSIADEEATRRFVEKSKVVGGHLKYLGYESFDEYYSTAVEIRFNRALILSKDNMLSTKVAYVFLEKMALNKAQQELTNFALNSDNDDLQEDFEKLAMRYKDWLRSNSKRIRMGLSPVKSNVTTQMNQFYQQHFHHEIIMISNMAININKARKDFR